MTYFSWKPIGVFALAVMAGWALSAKATLKCQDQVYEFLRQVAVAVDGVAQPPVQTLDGMAITADLGPDTTPVNVRALTYDPETFTTRPAPIKLVKTP